jgi:hypothetical protein
MAVTITTDLNLLYDGDTSIGGGVVFSGFQRFGAGCNGVQVSNGTNHYFGTVPPFSLVGRQIFSWMIGPGSIGSFAQGGYRIVIGDGTNRRAYYVGGADRSPFFVQGWLCYTLNGDNLPVNFDQLAGGAPNLAALTEIGVGFTTVAKANGNSPNCFFDVARVGTGLIIRGDPVAQGSFIDISNAEELTSNAWGVFRRVGAGIYAAQGRLTFGSATQNASFGDVDSLLFFEGNLVGSTFYQINTTSGGATTNLVEFGIKTGTGESVVGSNGVTIQSSAPYILNLNNANTTTLLYGSTIRGADNGINFSINAGNEIVSSVFDQSGQVNFENSFVRNITVSGTVDPVAGMLWNDSINIQKSSFNGNSSAIEHTLGTTYSYNDLTFAGNTFDVNFTGTGNLIINSSGTTNASSFEITGGGTSVTIVNTVSLTFTNLKTNSEVRIYNEAGDTELGGVENSTDTFTYSYSYQPININYVIFNLGFIPIQVRNLPLPASDTSLPVQQTVDRVYKNPT